MLMRLLAAACGLELAEGGRLTVQGPLDSCAEQLLRQLESAMQWERSVAREARDHERAKALTSTIKAVASLSCSKKCAEESVAEDQPRSAMLQSSGVCRAIVACRDRVRAALVATQRQVTLTPGAGVGVGVAAMTQSELDAAADELADALSHATSLASHDALQASAVPAWDTGDHNGTAAALLAAESQLQEAAADFCRALRDRGGGLHDKFLACDTLRAVLRRLCLPSVS